MVRLLVLGMVLVGLTGCVSEGPIYGYGGYSPYPAPIGRIDSYRGPRVYDGPVYARDPLYRAGPRYVRPPIYRDGPRYDRRTAYRDRRLERRFHSGPRFDRGRYDGRRPHRYGPSYRGPDRYERY
jgi:hypothetical protein